MPRRRSEGEQRRRRHRHRDRDYGLYWGRYPPYYTFSQNPHTYVLPPLLQPPYQVPDIPRCNSCNEVFYRCVTRGRPGCTYKFDRCVQRNCGMPIPQYAMYF